MNDHDPAAERAALDWLALTDRGDAKANGEYVVFQFTTAFENKRAATETVTPKRDTDGQWRASGYFIR